MPLSEHEQRILQEMEQTLREHDRDFVARVDHGAHRLDAARSGRWSILGAIAGFVLLLSTFRFSVGLGAIGFVLMVVSTLLFAQHLRQSAAAQGTSGRTGARGLSSDWSGVRRRIRSRFSNHDRT
ncbi:MAG: DUF3040 domain-containing protein [Acidimicrobiales bacterium]